MAQKKQPIHAVQVLPDPTDDALRSASMIRGVPYKAKLTQKELSIKLGIKQYHLSEMENGKASVGNKIAKNFAQVLECDYRIFI